MKFFLGGIFSTTILAMLAGYWYVCIVKNHCFKKPTKSMFEERELKDAYGAVIDFEDNAFIYKNDSTVQFSNASFKELKKLVQFSKDYPKVEILVNGYYTDEEDVLNNGKNYGLARANSFKKLLVEKGVQEESIVLKATVKNDLFDESGKASGTDAVDFGFMEMFPALSVLDMKQGYRTLINLEKSIFFRKNDSTIVFRKGSDPVLEDLQLYLNKHDEHKITVNSLYQKDERQLKSYDNVGDSRAKSFVTQIEKNNLKEEKLIQKFKIGHQLFNKMEQAKQKAFSFNFVLPDPNDKSFLARKELEQNLEEAFSPKEQKEVIEEASLKQDVDINFKLGSDRLFMSPKIKGYVKKLKQHLEEYPTQKVYITGHTCNRGSEKFNYELGFNRAGSAMLMLKDNGVDKEKIVFDSKGELEPIYSNSDETGQEKNRRIQIEIKN